MKRSSWLTLAVERAANWPAAETVIDYDGVTFYLLPETEHGARAISVELKQGLDMNGARAAIYRFLSAYAWVEDQPIAARWGVGSSRRGGVGREPGPVRPGNARFHLDFLPATSNPKARLALALYREALCEENVAYKMLGFFKIINVLHEKGSAQKAWITSALPFLTEHTASERLKELRAQGTDVAHYLYESGRCAVAHAFTEPIVDPDDPEDEARLHADLPVMKALAVRLIEHDFQIQTARNFRREHLYQLAGFRELLGSELVQRLKRREEVPTTEIPRMPGLTIRVRDVDPYPAYINLTVEVIAVQSGGVVLEGISGDRRVRVRLGLDFPEEMLRFEPHASFVVDDDGSSEAVTHMLDELRFVTDMFHNRQLEVFNAETGALLGRSDPYIPLNMRSAPPATVAQMRAELEAERTRRLEASQKST